MNEQIKSIGRRAGLVFIEDGVYGQRWYSSKCGLDASEYEKLVELIVQKCADIGERYADGNYEVPNQILEYFGMEEE